MFPGLQILVICMLTLPRNVATPAHAGICCTEGANAAQRMNARDQIKQLLKDPLINYYNVMLVKTSIQ